MNIMLQINTNLVNGAFCPTNSTSRDCALLAHLNKSIFQDKNKFFHETPNNTFFAPRQPLNAAPTEFCVAIEQLAQICRVCRKKAQEKLH